MSTKGSESCRCLGLGPVLIEGNGVEEYSTGLNGYGDDPVLGGDIREA